MEITSGFCPKIHVINKVGTVVKSESLVVPISPILFGHNYFLVKACQFRAIAIAYLFPFHVSQHGIKFISISVQRLYWHEGSKKEQHCQSIKIQFVQIFGHNKRNANLCETITSHSVNASQRSCTSQYNMCAERCFAGVDPPVHLQAH